MAALWAGPEPSLPVWLMAAVDRGCVKTQNPKNRVVNCYQFSWFSYSKVGLRGKPLAKNTFFETISHKRK